MTSLIDSLDLAAVKRGQQQMWASGDYGAVAAMIHLVAERLVDSVDPAAGPAVLDFAGGTGNAPIPPPRRRTPPACAHHVPELLERGRARASAPPSGTRGTGPDYVRELLERGGERASAERLDILFEPADAEALPYADASYDVVLSVFGAMFAPDQETTAAELLRVTRPGGLIGLAAWTPEGFLGQWFRAQGAHVAPPAGLASPLRWGSEEGVAELLGDSVSSLRARKRVFTWRFPDAAAMVQMFRELYGPTVRAFAAVGEDGADRLERDLLAVVEQCAEPRVNAIAIPATYLEVVAVKR